MKNITRKNRTVKNSRLFSYKNLFNFDLTKFFKNIGESKLFIGLMMIFMNLGSRYIEIKLTKGQEMILKNIGREVLIFVIAFMGSRDLFIALILTAIFIILSKYVFNENCKYNLLPTKYGKIESAMDLNNDGKISQEEIDKAHEILKKAKEESQLNNKIEMLTNMSNQSMVI